MGLSGQLSSRRGVGLEHGELLLELLLDRLLLLLEGGGQCLDLLGTEGAEGAVHEELLTNELGRQGGLRTARITGMATGQLAAHPGARRRGAAARAAAAVALRHIGHLSSKELYFYLCTLTNYTFTFLNLAAPELSFLEYLFKTLDIEVDIEKEEYCLFVFCG